MIDTQIIKINTIVGPKAHLAPAGWEFNNTDKIVWSKLVERVAEKASTTPTTRRGHVIAGQIEVLTIILANSLGMASTYWYDAAQELAFKRV